MSYHCLIIQRDAKAAAAIARDFPGMGFKPYLTHNGESALGILRQWSFDAVLMDAEGFGAEYVALLRRLRSRSRSPVILLSDMHEERDQIVALESGATDVVTKPASARFITSKLRSLIEAGARDDDDVAVPQVRLGALVMHSERALATLGGQPLKLTVREFELLFLLASRPGEFVSRPAIAAALTGAGAAVGRSADMHVCRIRKKLEEHGAGAPLLETIYGRGYRLIERRT